MIGRKRKVGLLALALAAVAALIGGTATSAAATDNATYYIGSTWNPWTNGTPTSYSPNIWTKGGWVNFGGSYKVWQSGSTQYAEVLGGAGTAGNSTKLQWKPCIGSANFYAPDCADLHTTLQLKRVLLVDTYGVVAKAEPAVGYLPALTGDDADSGAYDNYLIHVNGLGNIDYVRSNGLNYNWTTTHVSGTGGFTTPLPLGWSPKLCFNWQVTSGAGMSGYDERYHYEECHSLIPHSASPAI